MTPTLLSRLWSTPKSIPSSPPSSGSTPKSIPSSPSSSGSTPKSIPSSPPSSVSTIPYVDAHQPSRTVLITMGRCNFPFKNGAPCPCTAGSCTSELYLKGKEELCDECGHVMSLHCDYMPPSSPPHLPRNLVAASRFQEISPRTKTVEALAQLLEAYRVIHVRGTPSSGKTTLALLLLDHYKYRGEPVVLIDGWHNVSNPTTHLVEQSILSGYDGVTPSNLRTLDIVFLFDEAQQSYQDSRLWLGIIKAQSLRPSGPKICLFSSYGSPATGPTQYPHGSTPTHFGAEQRVSISVSSIPRAPSICLFYNEEEFSEVVRLRCAGPTHKFAMDPIAIDYLYLITNGHPGAVTSLLGYLFSSYSTALKHHEIESVTKELLIKALDDEAAVFKALEKFPVFRSFPTQSKLTVEAAQVLRKVLHNGNITRKLEDHGLRLCYEMGWLHSEATDDFADNILCVFPSKLHEKFVEYYVTLRNPTPFPFEKFSSLPILCEAVLRKFSRKNLLSSIKGRVATSARLTAIEAQFQDEWYRAFYSLLGHSVAMSSEWSRCGDGRIDFRIVEPSWGIEFLRDGDRLSEHCNRFVEKGTYHRWISNGLIKDWLVLDCRHSHPQKYATPGTKLWRVIFMHEYSSVYVLDCNNNIVIPEFPLMD